MALERVRLAVFLALAGILYYGAGMSPLASLGAVLMLHLATGGWKFAWLVIRTAPRDLSAAIKFFRVKLEIRRMASRGEGIPSLFERITRKHPHKTAFLSEGVRWSFEDVEKYSNAVGNYFISIGCRRGSTVGVFMESRPQFVAVWLGLVKVGIVPALINFNQRLDSLAHSIRTSACVGLVYGSELASAVKDAIGLIGHDVRLLESGASGLGQIGLPGAIDLDAEVRRSPTIQPDHRSKYEVYSTLMYIYTSGTTGLPKAAKISHARFYYMSIALHYFFQMSADDVIYGPLPLYHSAGGILGVGQTLIKGCTLVIRRKFSASNFWKDCIENNCTVVQYIGEICRYLLAQPERPENRQHRVRLAYGNGLRPQIWLEFQKRFGIKRIGEFYGATEGNASIANTDNTVGAIGWLTQILPSLYPVTLIKVDETTGEMFRGPDGLCIKCKPGEAGELVGKIANSDPFRKFDGYTNDDATRKKIAVDVFQKGDAYFLSGDILFMDSVGYLSFRDRTGDTFRWKGENVSTTEVESTISNLVNKRDVVVYGVEMPGSEGKAGMAAIEDKDGTLDLANLAKSLQISLPNYARPVFLRVTKAVDSTGTFKLMKVDMRKAGFDPSKVTDALYYLNSSSGTYSLLDASAYADISKGVLRF